MILILLKKGKHMSKFYIPNITINKDNEFFRKSFIGVPRYWKSTVLPENHCWANGELVLFSDWPELEEIYLNNSFAGMILEYNETDENKAANLGKWIKNDEIPTGLYVPNLINQFLRNWCPEADESAGMWHRDEIRNITGTAGLFKAIPGSNRFSGAFTKLDSTGGSNDPDGTGPASLSFDASLVVPTGPQNVPQHIWQPIIIYLGNHA